MTNNEMRQQQQKAQQQQNETSTSKMFTDCILCSFDMQRHIEPQQQSNETEK